MTTPRVLPRLFCVAILAGLAVLARADDGTRAAMRRVFDWQVQHPWSTAFPVESNQGTRGWVQGAFLTGVMEAYRATGDAAYADYARKTSATNGWLPGPRPDHADDHVVAQTYLELHELFPREATIGPTRAVLDQLVASDRKGRELWWWCDALYMAPPTLAKLSAATGDARYLAAMERWYWDTHAALFDPAEHLFYRDGRYVAPKEGPKIFWSRGNGWVFGGLARLLDTLPANYPQRAKYEALYQEMAARLLALQPADGLWRANLLDPAAAHGEASGSAFFCYGFAWGINHGLLPAAEYRPAVNRAWTALLNCIGPDGRLGWVQPIGAAPDHYDAESWQEYGTGAFLAAGGQMIRLQDRHGAP